MHNRAAYSYRWWRIHDLTPTPLQFGLTITHIFYIFLPGVMVRQFGEGSGGGLQFDPGAILCGRGADGIPQVRHA